MNAATSARALTVANFGQIASMKQVRLIFFLVSSLACSNCHNQQAKTKHVFSSSNILIIDTKFPLKLSKINLSDSQNAIHLNDEIENRIFQTVYSYYIDDCAGDSSDFQVKDSHIATIRLHDQLQAIFLVLLHHPTGMVNGKVLIYDNSSKDFIDKPLDFNLHALYDYDNGKLKPSNLKETFKIDSPEIALLFDEEHKINNFKFTRLYHNGTANAIETAILKVTSNTIDTLDFNQNWISN